MGQQHQRSIRRNLQQNVQQFSRSTNPPSPVYRYSRPFHCNRQQQAPNSDPRGRTQVETDMNRHTTAANTATAPEKLDISDVRDPSDISQLTAKQLKTILTRNCIDYKGVFEKEVLREKVMQLWIDCNEKRNLRNPLHDKDGSQLSDDIDEKSACKICMEREINCVLLECGHMLTCVPCGRKLAECPICRQNITRCVRTFKG